MDDESDGSLFTFLEFIGTDPVEGNAALTELMRRYEATVRRSCDRLCQRFPLLNISGDELTNDTFMKAVQSAATYVPLDKSCSAREDHFRYTAAWLFKIARNLFYDLGRDFDRPRPFEREITEPDPMSSEDVAALLGTGNPRKFEASDIPTIAKAFEDLPEKSQIVIVWTLDKRQHSRGGKYMNRGSIPELERILGTTAANIRQIRRRALAKIGDAVARSRKIKRGQK